MPTPYEVVYASALSKFRSYEIPLMTEDEVKDYLHDFLKTAIARFHVCRKDLKDRDDEAECFNIELSDIEVEILSNYLLLEYIDATYIRNSLLLKVNLSSSDFNSYSPANMLDKLLNMQEAYLKENEALISRYAWLGAAENQPTWVTRYKKQ